MDKAFVDTDVILDFLLDRIPFSDAGSILFSLNEEGKIKLYTSALVFSDAYYILRKFSNHRKIVDKLSLLIEDLEIIPINGIVVRKALKSPFKDLEDAIQNFAAWDAKLKMLITRNIKDYQQSELSVMTPEGYLATRNL